MKHLKMLKGLLHRPEVRYHHKVGGRQVKHLSEIDGGLREIPRHVAARRPPFESSAERQPELGTLDAPLSARKRRDGEKM